MIIYKFKMDTWLLLICR